MTPQPTSSAEEPSKEVSASCARAGSAQRAGKIAVATAVALALGKLLAGILGNSAAVMASAVDSLMDVFASSANTLAIHLAEAGPDREHAFGHAKFEALATAAQGLLVGGSAVYLFVEGFQRVLQPEPLRLAAVTLGTMAASAVSTLVLVAFLKSVAKKSGSKALAGDALHYSTDVWANLAVLGGVGLTYATHIDRIDGVLSIVVAGYVLWSAVHLLRAGVGELLDAAASPEQVAAIEGVLATLQAEGTIQGHHELRTRAAGRMVFVDVHIELPGEMKLSRAHHISDDVLMKIRNVLDQADVLIHLDSERDQP